MKMGRVGAWSCLALSALLGASGAVWWRSLELPSEATAPRVSVAGLDLGSVDAAAAMDELTRRVESTAVTFALGTEALPAGVATTLGAIGVGVDREATLRQARSIGRRGSPLERWRELRATRDRGIDVPLELTFDRQRLFRALEPIKRDRDRAPVPARYPQAKGALVPEVPGRYLDLERAADVVWSLAKTRAASVGGAAPAEAALRVPLIEIAVVPRVNAEALREFSPRRRLAQYSTHFRTRGDQATRAANIAVAASRLDGIVLMPGDRVSFNQVVGERSLENGFLDSWEILDGEFVRGVGGGTCQVSSTLNAAALSAGLDIIEGYTHSRPLAYIEKGLDATVAWPFIDLQIKNPWPLPIVIQALVRERTITVSVLANDSPGRVSLRSEVKETYPFPRVVEVGRVARGSFKLEQAGIPGYRIARTRVIRPLAGATRREVVYKRYRPTPELFLVAPDFDVRELPPLPEGAEGYDPALDPARAGEERGNDGDDDGAVERKGKRSDPIENSAGGQG
jgi:vancomycin resistance protein YoaR